jgi:hypothetical protein
MLVRLLYSSESSTPISPKLMDDILRQSRAHNPDLGVTGLLCVSDNIFIQVLEGGRDEVCELYHAIVRDNRHHHIRLLTFEEISERKFGNWTMGQVKAEKINPGLLLKYFKKPKLNPAEGSGAATMALLQELVATAGIVNRSEG